MEQWNYATNVLVALIGFGITALLGVNIWYSFRIGSKIKKRVSEGLYELKAENNKLRSDMINHTAASICLMEGKDYADKGWYDIAFLRYIKSVEYINKIDEKQINNEIKDILDQCLDNSLILVKQHNEQIIGSGTVNNMKKTIEHTLIETKDKRSNELFAFLISMFHKG